MLLNIDKNAKTIKGQKYNFLTGIMYFAPSTISGFQVCPMARIADCEGACLYTAGRGAYSNIQQARIKRTKLFFENRPEFFRQIIKDIQALIRKANREFMIPLVRLNGTSDINWEYMNFYYEGKKYYNLMELFPDVQFYDYTKIIGRDVPNNYDLTFSYSGVPAFQKMVERAQKQDMRIAAVFRNRYNIPDTFLGWNCISGDDSDIRHIEPKACIVSLYAKGKAKKDFTGFVVDNQSLPVLAA
jgi:hypothetical protein